MSKRVHPDEDGEQINLVVVDQDGNNTYFRVQSNTRMMKVFSSYNHKHNKMDGLVSFLYNGNRIPRHATPAKLGMEDGDEITAMEQGMGGSYFHPSPRYAN